MVWKMSVLGHIITLVALSTFSQCNAYKEGTENGENNVWSMKSYSGPSNVHYPQHAILAGESTPVFLARKPDKSTYTHEQMIYDRLESDVVKKAFEYFKSQKFRPLTKRRRNVDDNISLVEELKLNSYLNRSERNTNEEEEFYYPSLLVVMEHTNNWPSNKQAQEKLIFEKILYALAYWNEVEIQLRRIRHPGVRIRIAAIVIGRDKDVTPATSKLVTRMGISLYASLKLSLTYWQSLRQRNNNFRTGTFNVVATMTDTTPIIITGYGFSVPSPACDGYEFENFPLDGLTGLIVYDLQDFGSIGHAVAGITHIIGRSATGIGASVDAGSLSSGDLVEIKNGLQEAHCWKKPLQIYPPGEPVNRLLRTDLL